MAGKAISESAAGPKPAFGRLRVAVLTFVFAFVVSLLILEVLVFWFQREDALASAERRAESLARILAAHMETTVAAADAALAQVAIEAPRLGGATGASDEWLAVLKAAQAGTEGIGSISVVDDQGIIRHSTIGMIVGQARRNEFVFETLSRNPAAGLVISKPFRSLTGRHRMLLPLGRPLTREGGSFAGAVVATLVPEDLRNFYRSVDLDGGIVQILHPSGVVLFAEPSSADPIGDDARRDPVYLSYRAGAPRKVLLGPLRQGERDLITAYTTTASPELVISVSLDFARALAPWRASAWVAGAATAALILALAAATILLLRQLEARGTAERTLAERERALAQAQKMEAVGQLTGGVAHDFNNLLTVIVGSAERLRDVLKAPPEAAHDALRLIDVASDRARDLTTSLLAFARKQTLEPLLCDMNTLVSGMTELLRRALGETVEIDVTLHRAPCLVSVDPGQVETALLNLCINARDAMPRGGRLSIETMPVVLDDAYAQDNVELTAGPYVLLAVTDSGTGMPPAVAARVFEPFFTTKETGKGSGLGLSMVYGFVKQSKGHIKIYSELGHGTTVKIYLPQQQADAAPAEPAAPTTAPTAARGETILLVEDDEHVREVTHAMLAQLGYKAIAAPSGTAALERLAENDVDLILTDVVLDAEMSGPELVTKVLRIDPGIKVLFMSGYPRSGALHNGGVHGESHLIQKPLRLAALAAKLRDVLDRQA